MGKIFCKSAGSVSITDQSSHPFRKKTDRAIKKRPPWKEYNLHIVVFVLAIISMSIGVREFKITEDISILLMPLIYSLILGLLLFLAKPIKFVGPKQSKVAEGAMVLFIGVIIAKLAVSSGIAINSIFQVGPALLFQLLGDLGTLLALPVALLLGFRREVIGMASSICREPNLGIIIDKYGFHSPETRGVLAIFVIGSILGTPFISFLASICISGLPIHPYAFAMASGIGSASMNAAALAPLMHMYPSMATQLEAFAGCSNVLSFCLGIYMCIYISLPIAERLYKWLSPILGKGGEDAIDDEYAIEGVKDDKYVASDDLTIGKIKRWATFLVIFSFIVTVGNFVGYKTPLLDVFIGMLILSLITIVGMSLERIVPGNVQSLVFISIIGILLAIPGVPTANFMIHYISNIELISIVTAFLGYVGIAIGNDWEEFMKIGWKGIIVTFIVITGTYLGSAILGQVTLLVTGVI